MSRPPDCDVAIIGGGPAGAAAATVLARAGAAAIVIERERFPRFHVGESLLPYQQPVLDRLGLRAKVEARGYPLKLGAHFLSSDGSFETPLDFSCLIPAPSNVTFQVDRADFDELLLRHAAESGARVLEEHTVIDLETSPGDCRLAVRDAAGTSSELTARWVIDASGQSTFLARRLGLREADPRHRKVALFTHYRGGYRRPGKEAGNINLVLGDGCWFWYIPLRGDLVSVGVVLAHERYKSSGLSAEAALSRLLAETPWVARALSGAEPVLEVRTAANFSYTARRYYGPGWVLAGDAASFLDPVFSTGVLLAMLSGEMAGEVLARRLRDGRRLDAAMFRSYGRRLRRWTQAYFRFIRSFYDPSFAALFFNPEPAYLRTMVHFLGGRADLGWRDHLTFGAFYMLLRLHKLYPFVDDPRTGAERAHHA